MQEWERQDNSCRGYTNVPEILLLQETRLDSDIRQLILNIEAKKQKAKNHTIYK